MLVDAEKAKQKLAKLAESDDWENPLQLAHLIRAADLSDCAPITPAENVVVLQLRGMAVEVALEGYGRFQSICIDAADLIESLSAQVEELRRALEWIADQERYTFAECSLAEQIISTAKNVIACKKEEK